MALTSSGAISLGDINTALGRSATAAISINDSQVRFIANQDAGSVNMNALRNKYTFAGTITPATFSSPSDDFYGYEKDNHGAFTGELAEETNWFYSYIQSGTLNFTDWAFSKAFAAPFPEAISFRVKVGASDAVSMGTRQEAEPYYYLQNVGGTLAMTAANVAAGLQNYQLSQV